MPTTTQTSSTGDQLLAFGALLGRSGKIIESEISGSSMGSTLPAGRRIRIRPLLPDEYRPGQVVAFVSGNTILAHRIIFRSRQGALTRGDNRSLCDFPVPGPSLLNEVNWQIFLALTSQDLYPYMASRLEPYIDCIETPREWDVLLNARRRTAVHNLRLRHELGRVIEALRESGIPALALKGVVLAYTTYADPSLRPMTDLDLLVPTGKREMAVDVLRKVGFEYPEGVDAIQREHCQRLAPAQEFCPPLRLTGSKVLLEVHSQLECSEPVLRIAAQEFWSRSVTIDLKGLTVRTLCPEDFLLHLCLHQSRAHRFETGLRPVVDLKVLLESRRDWNWTRIAATSMRSRSAGWMYLTLEAARDLVGAPVPDLFFQSLPRPFGLPSLRRLAEEQLLSAQCEKPRLPVIPSLLAQNSWRNRTRMFFTRMRLVRREELGPGPAHVRRIRLARLS